MRSFRRVQGYHCYCVTRAVSVACTLTLLGVGVWWLRDAKTVEL